MKIKGCVHLVVKNKKIISVITHLNKIPKNGIIHLKGDKIYSVEEFEKSHPRDHSELKTKKKIIISRY